VLPMMLNLISMMLPAQLMASIAVPLKYYTMISEIPMYLPAALDPLVTIFLIRSYRQAAKTLVRRFFRLFTTDN
jgi:hypothetical protein